jgi:hypothetical protein
MHHGFDAIETALPITLRHRPVYIRQHGASVMVLKEHLASKPFYPPIADVFDSDRSSLPHFWAK